MSVGPSFDPSLSHLLDTWFALKSNSPLHHVLSYGLFFCPEAFIALSDDVLNSLTYPGIDGTLFMIPGIYADLLKAFKQFADFQNKHGWIVPSGHWLELTFEHFEEFVSDHCTIVFPIPTPPMPSPLHPTTAMQTSMICPSPVDVLLAEILPKAATTLDSQQVYPPMLARACLQNSC